MAKSKKDNMQHKEERKNINEVDYAKTQSFLNSAISDISGYIKFFDTKVSIIMSALGVIISGIINCRQIIYDTYTGMEDCCLLHIFFCLLLVIFVLNVVLVYCWGILTIRAHVCNLNFKSLWFLKETKESYPFEIYRADIEKMTTKKTVASFAATLIVLFVILCICVFLNIN